MSDRLPNITAAEAVRALMRAGFSSFARVAATRSSGTKRDEESLCFIILEKVLHPKADEIGLSTSIPVSLLPGPANPSPGQSEGWLEKLWARPPHGLSGLRRLLEDGLRTLHMDGDQ